MLRTENFPPAARAIDCSVKQAVSGIEGDQQDRSKKKKTVSNVVKNVVPGFVAENEERFFRSHFLDEVVVDNHAFGSAEAGDIGIELVGFSAGVHQEHAFAGNLQTGALCKLLQVGG